MALVPLERLEAERPAFQAYSSVNGLASDEITALHADERGYLWVGTVDGLSRFDGERFVTFGVESGLPSAKIFGLEVVKGRLVVATAKGVAWLDEAQPGRRHFLPLRKPDGFAGEFDVLYGDREGRLWAGGSGGLVAYEGADFLSALPVELPAKEKTRVLSIVEDLSGTLWVGTEQGLVHLVPGRAVESMSVQENNNNGRDRVLALAVDEQGRLWVGHEESLYVVALPLNGEQPRERAVGARSLPGLDSKGRASLPSTPGEVRRFSMTGPPLRHLRSAVGRNLVSTGGFVMEIGTKVVRVLMPVRHVLEDFVSALEMDRDGNTWIGTEGHGLLRLRRDGVTKFGMEDGLPDRRIRSVVALPGGPLIVLGSHPDVLSIHRRGTFQKVHLKIPVERYRGWGWGQVVLRAQSGEWWLATGTGLCRFDSSPSVEGLEGGTPKHVYTTADGLGSNDVFRIFEDSRGDLWIGTFGEPPLTRWDARTGFLEPIRDPALPRHTPTAFAEDGAGNLWVAFYDHGLARRRNGEWQTFAGEGAPEGFVHALLLARNGVLWIGSGRDGLWRIDTPDAVHPVLSRYHGQEALPSQNVRALVEDAAANLWIGSTQGVARLDPTSGRLRIFGPLQGLPNEIVTSAARDEEGQLWFGTLDGLVRIGPPSDSPGRPPVALLTSVAVDGAPRFLSPLGKAELPDQELPAEGRRLSVEFVAPSLSPERAALFETRLAGAETAFGPPSDVGRAEFTGLAPGHYRFEVRAVRGSSAGPVASFGFVVPLPVWRQPWVIGSVLVAAASLIYAAHRLRLAHVLALERVRTGIATDLHDDLGSSLSRISLLAEVVRREVEGKPQAQRLAEDIGEAARGMGGALSDNIWSVDPRHDDLQSVADRISVFASDLFETRNIGWQMDLPEGLALQAIPPQLRRHLLLGLKEAVNNAAKHAAARSVKVGFRLDGRTLRVTVADDGRGIASGVSPAPGSGRGLAGMRHRAEEMGGALDVLSAPGGGTKVTFSVPLPRTA